MILSSFKLRSEQAGKAAWGESNLPCTRWPLSDDDGDTWPWVRDLDQNNGFADEANWFLNGKLSYPSTLEGLLGELHIANYWAGRQAIRYLCLREEQILGILQ